MKLHQKLLTLAALSFTLLAGLNVMLPIFQAQAESLPVGGSTYYLSGAGVTSTQNTIQLTSFTTPDGRLITMSSFGTVGYGALDPQTNSKIEDISFTGITQNTNGTATLTGVSRGLDFLYPYTTSNSLEHSHAGGGTFIITNTAGFYYQEFAMPNNNNDFTWPTASSSIATKGYVDGVAFGGVLPQASFIAQGVVQLATGQQAASSTVNGSAGPLAIPASIATSTYNASTSAYVVPVTSSSGKLDPNFLSLSTSSPTIGGAPIYQISLYRQYITSTGTTTFSVPTGVTSAQVTVIGAGGAGGGTSVCTGGAQNNQTGSGGGSGGYATKYVSLVGTTSVQVFVGTGGVGSGSTAGTNGQWSTFGTNGFYLASNGGFGGQPGTSGSVNGGLGATTTAADLSITGQNGGGGPSYISSGGSGSLLSGVGGSNPLGEGGASVVGTTAGLSGTGYGSGGSGASCQNAGAAAGGAGAQGAVMIAW